MPSAPAAFETTLDKDTTLILSHAQRVYFSLDEAPALDNRAGVSIRIVPEPSGVVTWTAGLIGASRAVSPSGSPDRRRSNPMPISSSVDSSGDRRRHDGP